MNRGDSNDPSGQATSKIRNEINEESLKAYLSQNLKNINLPITLSQFNLGQSNPTYLITTSKGDKLVLRKKPPGELISKKAHAVEREYKVLKALQEGSKVPVPKVYHLCENEEVLGTPFYVMEFLKGRVLADNNLPKIPINQRPSYWFEAVRALSELHLTKFEDIGLKDYGPNGNFYNRQFKVLSKISQFQSEVFDQNGNQPVPKLPRLEDLPKVWTKFNLKDEVSVMHGDYKLDNIIFHEEKCRVIGILDWELSTIGHPLYDLSTLLLWFYIPADKGGLEVNNSGLPPNFVDELIKHYCKLTNRPYPIQNWKACLGFSVFKYAVIFQGIAARVALGQASSANAKLVAENTVPMGELALKFFEQAELELNKSKNKL